MDVSLIICTRDRCRQLDRCLESAGLITFEREWELVIVDNGSVDETAAVVQKFAAIAPAPVHYAFESKRGKSNALNTALEIARGEIVAFTDDDCYPANDFLSQVWSAFGDPTVGYVTGRIMLHDPADYPLAINGSTTPLTFPARSFVRGNVQGANMAFRRQVLRDIGGFDPLLGPGSLFNAVAEDLDVAGRASATGWKGEYHPEVIVRHHHGRKASDAEPMLKSYAIGFGAYHMKVLLRGRHFLWFARGIYGVRWRVIGYRGAFFWEAVGAARYAYAYLTRAFRS